ncbi:MAG TPA: hypothetical protein VJS92_13150, partial [Candidatus Polarisedimenticolaceae bacterium]|nr:hypothetical protein [Candidatus Polarisedimenticolaceae bacterium]
LEVVDARGAALAKLDPLPAVRDALAKSADRAAAREVAWSARIDGKKLLAAKYPLEVKLSVFDARGARADAHRGVER